MLFAMAAGAFVDLSIGPGGKLWVLGRKEGGALPSISALPLTPAIAWVQNGAWRDVGAEQSAVLGGEAVEGAHCLSLDGPLSGSATELMNISLIWNVFQHENIDAFQH